VALSVTAAAAFVGYHLYSPSRLQASPAFSAVLEALRL